MTGRATRPFRRIGVGFDAREARTGRADTVGERTVSTGSDGSLNWTYANSNDLKRTAHTAEADRKPLGSFGGALRRFVAAAVKWVVAGAAIGLVLFARQAFIGWALIAGPFLVFTIGAALGAGVGEVVTGLRIRDTATGGRLRVPRVAPPVLDRPVW